MLFTIRNRVFEGCSDKNVSIVNDGKYGIINNDDNSYIIPQEYDNIFLYGINTFILSKNGKIGMCKITNNIADIICECVYDVVDNVNHNLFFSNDTGTRYYNCETNKVMDFDEITLDLPFIYCVDENYKYIITEETGEIIYKSRQKQSCYMFCGNTPNGAIFYDARYSMYLYPAENGYQYIEYPLNYPLIVNRENVLNIVESKNGVGVIDSYGKRILDIKYDEINLEINIIGKNKDEEMKKTIPLKNNAFRKDLVISIDKWI